MGGDLDTLLIFLFPPLFQEAGPWGERWLSPPRSFLIKVSVLVHPDMLFLWLSFCLSSLSPVCRGIHGIQIARWLILRFEGVEELDSLLLFTSVFEMDPLCVAS